MIHLDDDPSISEIRQVQRDHPVLVRVEGDGMVLTCGGCPDWTERLGQVLEPVGVFTAALAHQMREVS